MIVVRFRETFRERMPEWGLAITMLVWGLITLASTDLFNAQSFFFPLLNIMSQTSWGMLTALVGATRVIFLIINGAWRPSAHIRAIGCVVGCMLWGSLLVSALNLAWLTPTASLYATLLGFDTISLWFAAGDAKLADLAARGKLQKV